ncbi:MAG: AAA family ATPase [Bacteroidales bacterium]|nr:AAA family ATPase [Bacteroidales bacterium]
MKKEDNPTEAIRAEMETRRGHAAGLLTIKSANDTIADAILKPDPVNLYDELVIENEITCMFGDSNCGKTIMAVQIGEEIAQSRNVLYADFELSEKQFQKRYTGRGGEVHIFPSSFYRATMNTCSMDSENFEDVIFSSIKAAAEKVNAKVIIIDNLTYLCNESEKGEVAGRFMKKVLGMKSEGYTVLVVAHTPKRSMINPMTQNDLAGSKKLMNFFDSAFCIGHSAKDNHLRYIKQVKVRSAELKYDADSVLIFQIGTDENALRIQNLGKGRERAHLKSMSEEDVQNLEQRILSLHAQGYSYRQIQSEVGVSKSTVGRVVNTINKNEDEQEV